MSQTVTGKRCTQRRLVYTDYTATDMHDLFFIGKRREAEPLILKTKSIRKIFEIDPNQFH